MLTSLEARSNEWLKILLIEPEAIARITADVYFFDFGLKIALPGYAGASTAFIEGKPIRGLFEALASVAGFGAGMISKGSVVAYRVFAWTTVAFSGAEATVIMFEKNSSNLELIGPVLSAYLATPVKLVGRINLNGAWEWVSGTRGARTMSKGELLALRNPLNPVTHNVAKLDVVYSSGLKGTWEEDMFAVMNNVWKTWPATKIRNGKEVANSVGAVELENIKLAYQQMVTEAKLASKQAGKPVAYNLEKFELFMNENLAAGEIWSSLINTSG